MNCAATLSLGLAVLLLAGQPIAPRHELVMSDHHIIMGIVVSSTEDSVTFEHTVGETKDTTTYSVDVIDPHSFYLVRKEAVGDDAAAKVVLGEFCMAHGLFTRARNQFIEAHRLDSSIDMTAQIAASRGSTAEGLLADAQQLIEKGDAHGAYRKARAILRSFPKTTSAAKARKMVTGLSTRFDEQFAAQQTAEEGKVWEKKLDEVRGMIRRAAQDDTRGNSQESMATGERFFKTSSRIYADAMKKLDALAKQAKGNAELEATIADLRGHSKDGLVAVQMDVGSIYAGQTNYAMAAAAVNKALAVDPDNSEAKSLRANIATRASLDGVSIYPVIGRRR